jgi:4-carboxymuconolactone decarboxylase
MATNVAEVRIAPASPPYDKGPAEDFAALMPPGMAPIGLFRTLAKNPRVLRRVRRGGLLDPGSITLRQREIVILRTTARAGAEYEWGVHVAFFGGAAGLESEHLYASVWLGPEAACWSANEALLVRACDELHEKACISEPTWTALRSAFAEDQLIELLVLAGLYRTISYVVNGTGVALEEHAPRFPAQLR